MKSAIILAGIWFFGSVAVGVGYWVYGLLATVSLVAGQIKGRVKWPSIFARHGERAREVLRDESDPLHPAVRRGAVAQRGFIGAWLSAAVAGLLLYSLLRLSHW